MQAKEGVIDGKHWHAEKITPAAITCVVNNVKTLECLVKDIIPAARRHIIDQFKKGLENGYWSGLAFSTPLQLGVFLFDPATGSKMGNYGAQYDVVKDMDTLKTVEEMFDKVTEGCQTGDVSVTGTGLATQFEYFAPLHVQIGLEFGLRTPFSVAEA